MFLIQAWEHWEKKNLEEYSPLEACVNTAVLEFYSVCHNKSIKCIFIINFDSEKKTKTKTRLKHAMNQFHFWIASVQILIFIIF